MIFAIDFGTSRAKGAIFDALGTCLGMAEVELAEDSRSSGLIHEIDARGWLTAMAEIAGRLLGSLDPLARSMLKALVICGNGPTILPIDEHGEPLANAITWLDRRASFESEEASAALGYSLDAAFNLPKILWMRRHKLHLYEASRYFVSCPEFVTGRLTGEWTTCLPNRGYTRIIWNEAAVSALALDERKFPPSIGIGGIVGHVHAEAAEAYGVPAGLPVVMGGPDFIASLLGTATVAPGRTCDKGGTSEGINLCAETDFANAAPSASRAASSGLLVMPHIIEPYYNISGVISTSGKALAWFKDRFLPEKSFDAIYSRAERAKPGASGLVFLPYLAGERSPHWDPDASGVFLGLRLEHDLDAMVRAVMESTAFAMRDVISVMEDAGAHVEDLRSTGMPAHSAIWNQIKADITGKPVKVPAFSEPELAGCLAIGRFALGEEKSLAQAAEHVFAPRAIFEPRWEYAALYDELFSVYRETYRRLVDLFPLLRRAGHTAGSAQEEKP